MYERKSRFWKHFRYKKKWLSRRNFLPLVRHK